MNQPETQANLRCKRQKLHPRVVQYAEHFGVEPHRFLRFLKHPAEIAGLLERFRAVRRLETRPIPLKELLARPDEKKACKSSAKKEGK
jgi:hypothetical protein